MPPPRRSRLPESMPKRYKAPPTTPTPSRRVAHPVRRPPRRNPGFYATPRRSPVAGKPAPRAPTPSFGVRRHAGPARAGTLPGIFPQYTPQGVRLADSPRIASRTGAARQLGIDCESAGTPPRKRLPALSGRVIFEALPRRGLQREGGHPCPEATLYVVRIAPEPTHVNMSW